MHGTVQSDLSQNLWATPKGDSLLGRGPHTLNKLIKQFDLILDPCCSGPADCLIPVNQGGKFYTKEDDGLKQEWKHNSIFNCPFSQGLFDTKTNLPILKMKHNLIGPQTQKYESVIGTWIEKAISQVTKHGITAIGILPVYTSTIWFQQYIHQIAPVDFINGRVHFTSPDGRTGSPNFDTMLVFWIPRK